MPRGSGPRRWVRHLNADQVREVTRAPIIARMVISNEIESLQRQRRWVDSVLDRRLNIWNEDPVLATDLWHQRDLIWVRTQRLTKAIENDTHGLTARIDALRMPEIEISRLLEQRSRSRDDPQR